MCGECAGCLWARERYAMSALRCFITSKAKLKKNRIRDVSSRSDDLGTHIGHKPRLGSSERSACATGVCVFLCVSLHNCALLAYGRYF